MRAHLMRYAACLSLFALGAIGRTAHVDLPTDTAAVRPLAVGDRAPDFAVHRIRAN
jgi:hypothetical protein